MGNRNQINPPGLIPLCGENCDFEKRLKGCYNKLKDTLPKYQALGPNSNTFAASIISCAGGKTKFPMSAPGGMY